MKDNWIDPVSVSRVEEYISNKFPNAEDIQVCAKNKKYFVTFYTGSDVFDQDFGCVVLSEFTTSIDEQEIDPDWIQIVRECNEYRTIDGWTYDQDLVVQLERIVYNKKQASIQKAEDIYKNDVRFVNDILGTLNVKDKIEERQI